MTAVETETTELKARADSTPLKHRTKPLNNMDINRLLKWLDSSIRNFRSRNNT